MGWSPVDDTAVAHWCTVVDALPLPAALVGTDGCVINANRWIETSPGTSLVCPLPEAPTVGLAMGADRVSRWRVRPLDPDATVMLATAEREDMGDHLVRQFFSAGESLFVVYDQWGRVIESNNAWQSLLGYGEEEMLGIDSWSLLPPDDVETRATVEADLRRHGRAEPIFRMRRADGVYRRVKWALHFDGDLGRCFGIGRDITDEDRTARELHRRATTDDLTGLANRSSFLDRLGDALAADLTPVVLLLDLDHFKVVNDSLGQNAGDALLRALGVRLESLASSSDTLVARFGGDEFVILLSDGSRERAQRAAEVILEAMEEPLVVEGRSIAVTLSLGISMAEAGSDPDRILSEADAAVYEAKKRGRNTSVVFDHQLRSAVDRRFNVEARVRRALDDARIEAAFQPIVMMPGGGVVASEALVRLRTEDGELEAPGAFLDVAEEAGLLPEIDHCVLQIALDAGSRLLARGRPMRLSVNISASTLVQPDVVEMITAALARSRFPADGLMLEITESAVLTTDVVVPVLHDLRDAGIRIGLDDFGTGFSSLAHLRELPIDAVKIDRSFVADVTRDDVTRALTASLLDLCRTLSLDVVLEGVETTEQASVIETLGGRTAQGYLFHRPMPFDDLARLVTGSAVPAVAS